MKMFADRLKELREENSFTMREAAQLIGVSQATYNHWEKDGVFPRPDMLRKIASAYDVKLKWLEIGQGPKNDREERKQEIVSQVLECKNSGSVVPDNTGDRARLKSVNLVIENLKVLPISTDELMMVHKTLSEYRMHLESRVLFG